MDDNKVAVLFEDLRAQFRTFGEESQLLNEKVDREFNAIKTDIGNLKNEVTGLKFEASGLKTNHQEHQQLMQMIKELDKEVQVETKRVK